MDRSTTSLNSMDDLSAIETTDADNDTTSPPLATDQLRRQVLELTEQLNESRATERRANSERDKYMQMYNRTNERFANFERKQLEQMRRILTMLTPNQHRSLMIPQDEYQRPKRAFTSPSTSILLPSVLDQTPAESSATVDCNDLLTQISEVMDFTEEFSTTYTQQNEENMKLRLLNNQKQDENVQLLFDLSVAKAEYEKEQQMRVQYETQLSETNKAIEQERSKRMQKLRNYALLADDEGDILLSSLMKKAEKNDVDFREIKLQYESVFAEQMTEMKKLTKEREISHMYIERLEGENRLLASRTNEDETVQLLTESAQSPQSYEEARELIVRLRAQIIEQIKLHDQFRNDLQQVHQCHTTDMREREEIEKLLNRDLAAAKDEIVVLETIRSEYDRVLSFKKNLELQLEECANELLMNKAGASPLINQLKEKLEQISAEKEKLSEDNAGLRVQLQKLKVDFENSESVQHDFVKLSQSLQMQLEELRNSGNELRWQPEDDFSACQRCHQPFTVTWRKHHCRHCGKVLCKDCTSKTVYTGPNNRPSRVCDICYTLLDKTAQPYFLARPPKY